jgi:hypothetical protein
LKPEDAKYVGEINREIDPDEIIKKHGYDPLTPLELLLLAIIDAHKLRTPAERANRLYRALNALTGHRKQGRASVDDYPVLLDIAWRYHRIHFRKPGNEIDLAPIIRASIGSFPNAPRSENAWDSRIRRMRRKFVAHKDVYLVRATSQDDWKRMDTLRILTSVAEQLRSIGVPIELATIAPVLGRRTERR